MKKLIITIATIALTIFGLSSTPAYAVKDICSQPGVTQEIKDANGCGGNSGATTDLTTVIVNIINGVVGILSLVAVIFIVVGGVNYMTSAGDSGKVQKAKNTILYALIGLIICALAFAIVNFVIVNIIDGNSSGGSDSNTPIQGGGPVSLVLE